MSGWIAEILIGVAILLTAGTIFIGFRLTAAARAAFPPYREVTDRRTDVDGTEIVTLACGHQFRVTYHRRHSLPCECCKEERG